MANLVSRSLQKAPKGSEGVLGFVGSKPIKSRIKNRLKLELNVFGLGMCLEGFWEGLDRRWTSKKNQCILSGRSVGPETNIVRNMLHVDISGGCFMFTHECHDGRHSFQRSS